MMSFENNYCIDGYELKMFVIWPITKTNQCSGSGGGTNVVNLTWSLAQQNPSASFLN